ncbi:hypothetical protein HED60_04510 [Planctomycetales bacterium ZRK34]|nr:hypothetical protein HED60_04510 [Planctomycetales bacterium ZRK34]
MNGKVRYFGHGSSPDDVRSYREAERKYIEFLKKLEDAQPVEVPANKATVEEVAEKYLQNEYNRAIRGEISVNYFDRQRRCAEVFVDFLGRKKKYSSINELDLDDYRQHCLSCPPSESTGRPISLATVKARINLVKSLILWAWERRLCEMPRNLRSYTRFNLPTPTPKVFTVEEIKTLWKEASQRLRCFVALGLNCAMGQQDISDLRLKEINFDEGYIERGRSKTGVRSMYKLWPVTMELIRKEMVDDAGPDDRVFLNGNDLPLVRRWLDAEGKAKMSDAVGNLFWRLQRNLCINGGRGFYSLRATGATEIERINPLVTELYLAHAERGMKRHYAVRDWSALDDALEVLGHIFDLSK